MGDSYATGVGAGKNLDKFSLCYRFSNAYAPALQRDVLAPQSQLKFNFPACAGKLFAKIRSEQLGDGWGKAPGFVTISMGGNDIGFKELVTKCIYGMTLFTLLTPCQKLIDAANGKLDRGEILQGAKDTLNAILAKSRKQGLTNSFKIYVIGYTRFFNEVTTQCNGVRGLKTPKFLQWGEPEYLTIELRKKLNALADKLNMNLLEAVKQTAGTPAQVVWVPINDLFEKHRFCDRNEPNPDDPQTWIFTFYADDVAPGKAKRSPAALPLQPIPPPGPPPAPPLSDGEKRGEALYKSIPPIQAIHEGKSDKALTTEEFIKLIHDAADGDETKYVEGVNNVKVFHPKSIGHQAIEKRLQEVIQTGHH